MLDLSVPDDSATMEAQSDEGLRYGQEKNSAARTSLWKRPACRSMFASSPHSKLAALLIFTTCAFAADQPPTAEGLAPPERFSAEQRGHWAYQPVKRLAPDPVKDSSWACNPIDRFILAELEDLGQDHSPPASRIALIRRVTFDLAGRPPSTEEVAAFVGR